MLVGLLMDSNIKNTGDTGGIASGEAGNRKEGRKRKKGGAVSSMAQEKVADTAEEVILVGDEVTPPRANPPLGPGATAVLSQADTVQMGSSKEASPAAHVAKKGRTDAEKEGKDAEADEDDDEEDFLRQYFLKEKGRIRKSSLADKPQEEVKVLEAFKESFDTAAGRVWRERNRDCSSCETAYDSMACYYNMTSRMISMLWHREKVRESKLQEMGRRITDLEEENRDMSEERGRLKRELEEERLGKLLKSGVDVGTSTDVGVEEENPPPTTADPGLLAAIDEVAVRRLREWTGAEPVKGWRANGRKETGPTPFAPSKRGGYVMGTESRRQGSKKEGEGAGRGEWRDDGRPEHSSPTCEGQKEEDGGTCEEGRGSWEDQRTGCGNSGEKEEMAGATEDSRGHVDHPAGRDGLLCGGNGSGQEGDTPRGCGYLPH